MNAKSRPGFVFPLILIFSGLLLLLSNFGLVPFGFFATLLRFWPSVLVLVGIELLFGKSDSDFIYALGIVLSIALLAVIFLVGLDSRGFSFFSLF